MDLADAIEESRQLARRVCIADFGLSSDEVYAKSLLDVAHILDLKRKLESIARQPGKDDSSLKELIVGFELLSKKIGRELVRPTDDDLCQRFSTGTLGARTVLEITGWSVEELYDNCQSRGLPLNV